MRRLSSRLPLVCPARCCVAPGSCELDGRLDAGLPSSCGLSAWRFLYRPSPSQMDEEAAMRAGMYEAPT